LNFCPASSLYSSPSSFPSFSPSPSPLHFSISPSPSPHLHLHRHFAFLLPFPPPLSLSIYPQNNCPPPLSNTTTFTPAFHPLHSAPPRREGGWAHVGSIIILLPFHLCPLSDHARSSPCAGNFLSKGREAQHPLLLTASHGEVTLWKAGLVPIALNPSQPWPLINAH
jgi:hypothetical protein